jgi:hypothetical protein
MKKAAGRGPAAPRALRLCGYLFARFRAAIAGIGAVFAVLMMLVLRAFISASAANFGAQRTNLFRKGAVALHGFRRKGTYICGFAIEADTFGHHFHVVFFQAVIKTAIALFHATKAFLHTFVVSHGNHPFFF